jgi:hypothetical protein
MEAHLTFESEGTLSLWIGQFGSEDELMEYVEFVYADVDDDEDDEEGESSCPFATDAGLDWFDHDVQEANFLEEGLSDAEEALAGHSYSSSFAAAAAAAIQQVKTARDNAIFILYDFAYDPKVARPKNEGRLRFVGTFTFDKNAPDIELRERPSE